MSEYQTGNPVPSTDPRDLDDNATAFDRLINSSDPSAPDRLGAARKTWWQMEQDAEALVSPNVSALAALSGAADRGFYFTGSGAMALYTLSSLGRTLGGIASQAAGRSAIAAAASGSNNDILSLSGLTTALSVVQGGTGATSAGAARTSLGAAASGANSDILSLSGLTTALSVAQGGTGVTTSTGTGAGVHTASPNLTTPNIVGTATNNNAAAGSVGEFISSTVLVGSAVSLTSSTIANVTSISLTAGDWEVWGTIATNPAGTTTMSNVSGAINTVSATFPTTPGAGAIVSLPYATPAGQNPAFAVGRVRLSLASTTTVYLCAAATFAVSTNAAYGFLGARRVR